MGAKESKPSCVSYEDAVKRVTESELLRLKDAFKKSAGVGRLYLSRNAFQQDVLFEGVPSNISDLLYNACGGTSKGISFKDLLCGLVLFTRGTDNEKARFLWNLYCNDTGTYIQKSDYMKVSSSQPIDGFSMFAHNDRVNFDQFQEWILSHRSSTVLSKWLLLDVNISLTSELETPTFYQSLAGVTHLEEKDIGDLEKEFWRLKNSSPNGQLDLQLLGPLISPPIPKSALIGLFNAFDENRDGHIDFKELCCGVSAACRGPCVERMRFCFKIFDVDRDGILDHKEIMQMINVLLFVAKENYHADNYVDLNKQDAINDIRRFLAGNGHHQNDIGDYKEDAKSTKSIPGNVEAIILTAEDFMMWSVGSSCKLVQPFLDLTFEVCHIVFGLWPQCRHMEYEIACGWLKREEKRSYRIGQFWYLISREWWHSWLQYTQSTVTSCDCCKRMSASQHSFHLGSVDEALVCDENFTSNYIESLKEVSTSTENCSIGSTSSDISVGHRCGRRPGPIDNSNLIIPNLFKNIRTLTGEGGHLRRSTPLVQRRDFELVPKSLWKAFNRWYGDSLPLPRQVIKPPDATEVELELYPLNLRILLHQSTPNNLAINSWTAMSGGYGVMASGGGYAAISGSNILLPPKRFLAYTAAFSRLATVRQIGEFLCDQLRLKAEDIRLWHIPIDSVDTNAILLEDDNMTLQEILIKDNDQILLEIRNKDLTWPEELGSLALSQGVTDRRMTRTSILSVHAPGATGLHNLGNTCFMNAALQVLFNTQPLAQYFAKNMHLLEVNTLNKLGTRGQLATRFGELLQEILTATTRSVAPLKLRFCVTKHASQFAGGGQHDSQEFLEWFLDALHEDLNRVTEKSYSELKDSNSRPDQIVAAEAWAQHHARNQSIIIDLFYGQLKSKVSCLCCGHESVRFDPFSLLSLPLPVENYVYCEAQVILLDGTVPVRYGLRLNSESKYVDLKKKLSLLCKLDFHFMLVCEIWNSQVKQILSDELKIKKSSAKELYVYQLPELTDCSRRTSTLSLGIAKGLKDIQRNTVLGNNGDDSSHALNIYHSNQSIQYNYQAKMHEAIDDTIESNNSQGNSIALAYEDDDDDEDNHVATKQAPSMSCSPKDSFSNTAQMRVSSTKLLHQENCKCCMSITTPLEFGENTINTSSAETLRINCMSVNCKKQQQESNCPSRLDSNITALEDNAKTDNDNAIGELGLSKVGRYLLAVHRKITRQDSYFLSYNKTRPSLFGVPLLVPNCEGATHKDLYCSVWLQVTRLLSPLPASMEQANHAADCDDSLGYDFPFTLRSVKGDGLTCAICPWSNFCRGCKIPCNNDFLVQGSLPIESSSSTPKLLPRCSSVSHSETHMELNATCSPRSFNDFCIAIDWDPTAVHLRYQSALERLCKDHETIAICRGEQTEPVDLNHCLEAFTSEEKLEQWYYCSHCKGKKPATKKLQIWKLPPILIVHLKRFNCVNGKWVKSQKVVNFPFKDFDPVPYLAAVPQETILRHKELFQLQKMNPTVNESDEHINKNKLADIGESERETHRSECIANNINNGNSVNAEPVCNNFLNNAMQKQNLPYAKKPSSLDNCHNVIIYDDEFVQEPKNQGDKCASNLTTTSIATRSRHQKAEKRKRLISSSLTRTPIVDGEFEDFHQHKLKSGEDNFDPNYKLYAVVSHSGILNGGHYISYAANQNGSWYCYNDSSCRQIPGHPYIDPSSAYLLFYERRGLDYEPYLPNIDGKVLPRDGLGMDMDESDNDLKRLCTVS